MKPDLKLVENTGSQLEAEMFEFDPPPQQQEMPFAVVEGEPVTQLPRDLYIPPDALQVFLEAFEGPLDLLLYLIRRQNLDILDIPIAEITRQYMQYIEVMSELQLELAGEYLLMAAMLAEIKSRMLLPRPSTPEGAEEEDPRAELVRRLQEYERFKKAAEDIDRLPRMERDHLPTAVELVERKVVKILPQVTLQEMLLALKDVMQRAEMFAHHQVHKDRLSVRQRMSDILSTLRSTAFVEFTQMFRAEEGRMGVTVTFSAILELMKEGLIEIVQAEPYAPLHIRPSSGSRHLSVVSDNDRAESTADAENEAALAQPAQPDENDIDDEDDDVLLDELEGEDEAASDAPEAIGDAIESADQVSELQQVDAQESDAQQIDAQEIDAEDGETLEAPADELADGSDLVDADVIDELVEDSVAETEVEESDLEAIADETEELAEQSDVVDADVIDELVEDSIAESEVDESEGTVLDESELSEIVADAESDSDEDAVSEEVVDQAIETIASDDAQEVGEPTESSDAQDESRDTDNVTGEETSREHESDESDPDKHG